MKALVKLLFLSILVPTFAQAQSSTESVSILMGPELRSGSGETLGKIIGSDDSGYYMLVERKKLLTSERRYTIEKYNKDLRLLKTLDLSSQKNKLDLILEEVLLHNGRLCYLSSEIDRRNSRKVLYYQDIDPTTLKFTEKPRKIANFEYRSPSIAFKRETKSMNFDFSRDSSKIIVYLDIRNKLREKDEYEVCVFDSQFQSIWQQTLEMPFKNSRFDVRSWSVDNDGIVYLIGAIYEETGFLIGSGFPDKFKIWAYRDLGKTIEDYEVKAGNKFVVDLQLAVDESQDLICAGFYSDDFRRNIDGSYFMKIDKASKEIKALSYKAFPIEDLIEEGSDRQKDRLRRKAERGQDVGLNRFKLDEIIIRDDGGAVLIAEQYYVVTTTTANNNTGGGTTNYTYHYNDLVVVNIAPSGEIDWIEIVPKRQVSSSPYYLSYTSAVVGDKIFFVFNDNRRNLDRAPGEKLAVFSRLDNTVQVMLVQVDGSGTEKRKALFSAKDAEMLVAPSLSKQVNDELILFGSRQKNQRYIKISF